MGVSEGHHSCLSPVTLHQDRIAGASRHHQCCTPPYLHHPAPQSLCHHRRRSRYLNRETSMDQPRTLSTQPSGSCSPSHNSAGARTEDGCCVPCREPRDHEIIAMDTAKEQEKIRLPSLTQARPERELDKDAVMVVSVTGEKMEIVPYKGNDEPLIISLYPHDNASKSEGRLHAPCHSQSFTIHPSSNEAAMEYDDQPTYTPHCGDTKPDSSTHTKLSGSSPYSLKSKIISSYNNQLSNDILPKVKEENISPLPKANVPGSDASPFEDLDNSRKSYNSVSRWEDVRTNSPFQEVVDMTPSDSSCNTTSPDAELEYSQSFIAATTEAGRMFSYHQLKNSIYYQEQPINLSYSQDASNSLDQYGTCKEVPDSKIRFISSTKRPTKGQELGHLHLRGPKDSIPIYKESQKSQCQSNIRLPYDEHQRIHSQAVDYHRGRSSITETKTLLEEPKFHARSPHIQSEAWQSYEEHSGSKSPVEYMVQIRSPCQQLESRLTQFSGHSSFLPDQAALRCYGDSPLDGRKVAPYGSFSQDFLPHSRQHQDSEDWHQQYSAPNSPDSPQNLVIDEDVEDEAMDLRLVARVAAEQEPLEVPPPHDPLKKISTKRKRDRGPKSWEFLMRLLADESTNPAVIRWEDRANSTFRLVQPKLIAQMWGRRSGKPDLTYNNFARALRYHYSTKFLIRVSERQLVYGCGRQALTFLASLKENKD